MRKRVLLLGTLVALGAGGCRDKSQDELLQKPISTRARESALAKSGLPGATGIGAALRVSDSADARRKREDSIAKEVP